MDTKCRVIVDPSIPEFKDCFYFEDKGRKYAQLCYELIKEANKMNSSIDSKIPKIGLYETHHHKAGDYDCCWYAGFINLDEEVRFIVRFEVWASDVVVLFQSPCKVPKVALKNGEEADSINYNGWLPVFYSNYVMEKANLIEMLSGYIKNVHEDWSNVKKSCGKRRSCKGNVIRC